MRKINELFYSLQGEGFHTGTPAVFIRFSGCNLKCDFCDTRHESGTLMTDEELLERVSAFPCRMVILTGGEPGLWIDDDLVEKLHALGKYVAIETNGTCVLPEAIDWVTCSPKQGGKLNVKRIDEVSGLYRSRARCGILSCPACPALFLTALFVQQYGGSHRLHQSTSPMAVKSANTQADSYPLARCISIARLNHLPDGIIQFIGLHEFFQRDVHTPLPIVMRICRHVDTLCLYIGIAQ